MHNIASSISLKRDCDGIVIPYGHKTRLTAGTRVYITQSLGGTYTVTTEQQQMVRIDGKDADALGLGEVKASDTTTAEVARPALSGDALKQEIWAKLRTVYDPEIPVNVVDLGLVYDVVVDAHPQGDSNVRVKMTLTAPGCGMGDVLKNDAHQRVSAIPGVGQAEVEIVLDPPWDKEMMSEAAKLQLGML